MEIKYDSILKDRDLNQIFKNNYFERVYDLLGKFVLKFNLNHEETKALRDRLFIEYMNFINLKRKNSHVYERILVGVLNNYGFKNIIIYILNQDIDLNYIVVNRKNIRTPLMDILATSIKDKDIMNIFLRKISNLNISNFKNNYTNEEIDICRMNIIANNLALAYKLFNNDNYYLIKEDLIKILKENYQIELVDFDYKKDDKLYQIILTIKEAQIDDLNKKKILIAILKNPKIKILNMKILDVIKEILGNKLYEQFLEYLKESDIVLYNVSLTNEKVIYLDNLDNIYSKVNVKKLINSSRI